MCQWRTRIEAETIDAGDKIKAESMRRTFFFCAAIFWAVQFEEFKICYNSNNNVVFTKRQCVKFKWQDAQQFIYVAAQPEKGFQGEA